MLQLEYLITVIFGVFVLFEVVIPVAKGQPLFPHTRKKDWAQRQLQRAHQRHAEAVKLLEAAKVAASAEVIEKQAGDLRDAASKIEK
jgi:hypothetical protein